MSSFHFLIRKWHGLLWQLNIKHAASKMSGVFSRFSICLSYNSCGTHLLVFWIFLISSNWLEKACWLTFNCSASYFCVCESSSSNNAFYSIPSIFWRFSMFPVFFLILCWSHHFWNAKTIVHTYFVIKHVHHKLLEVIDMIRQQFFFQSNQKLLLFANALCSV